MDFLRALPKWLLSFTKRDWSVSDYPLVARRLAPEEDPEQGWMVRVVHWPTLIGFGASLAEARTMIEQRMDAYRETHGALPRPGTPVPLEFAPSIEVERHAMTVNRILEDVLGFEPGQAVFVSDESSLGDFDRSGDGSLAPIYDAIEQEFGVDARDIEDGNLLAIARRIDGFE